MDVQGGRNGRSEELTWQAVPMQGISAWQCPAGGKRETRQLRRHCNSKDAHQNPDA